jgi:hypothetical protein
LLARLVGHVVQRVIHFVFVSLSLRFHCHSPSFL